MTLTYTPTAAQQVSGIQQDFRGANNYRPNVSGDPLVPEGERTINNWLSRTTVTVPTDPSQPFGNAPRNSVRGPLTVDGGHGGVEALQHAVATTARSSSAASSSTCSTA